MSQFIEVVGNSDEGLGRVTRLWLRSFMQQFGEVIQIHKPPTSGDPRSDVATVRFAKQEQAEAAVTFLKSGNALLNGTPIAGDWKTQAKGGRPSSGVLDYDAPIVDSRSFLPAGSRPDRSRSRRRTVRGSPRRGRSESRGRGGTALRKRSRSRSRGLGLPRAGPGSNHRDEPQSKRGGPEKNSSRPALSSGVGGKQDDSRSRGKAQPSPSALPLPPAPPPAPTPRGLGLSAEEHAELESLRAMASEEEKEMEELRRMMAARDAAIAQLEAKVLSKG